MEIPRSVVRYFLGMTRSDGSSNSNLYSSRVKPICVFLSCPGMPGAGVFPFHPAGADFIISQRQKKATLKDADRTGFSFWPCRALLRSTAKDSCGTIPGCPPVERRKENRWNVFLYIFSYSFHFTGFLNEYAYFPVIFVKLSKKFEFFGNRIFPICFGTIQQLHADILNYLHFQ